MGMILGVQTELLNKMYKNDYITAVIFVMGGGQVKI